MKKAIIFDFDGTIADTMSLHNNLELDILRRFSIDMDRSLLRKTCAGVPFQLTMEKLFEENNVTNADPKILIEEKRSRMLKLIETDLKPMPDLIDVLNMLKDANYRLVIGTTSRHAFVDRAIHNLGLDKYFEYIVCAEDVGDKAKPAPDIFLRCAELLGVKPENCIVIEDGINGVLAAKNANMKSIAYAYDQNPNDFPADLVISDYNELKLSNFEDLSN